MIFEWYKLRERVRERENKILTQHINTVLSSVHFSSFSSVSILHVILVSSIMHADCKSQRHQSRESTETATGRTFLILKEFHMWKTLHMSLMCQLGMNISKIRRSKTMKSDNFSYQIWHIFVIFTTECWIVQKWLSVYFCDVCDKFSKDTKSIQSGMP